MIFFCGESCAPGSDGMLSKFRTSASTFVIRVAAIYGGGLEVFLDFAFEKVLSLAFKCFNFD